MAINPNVSYAGRVTAPDANYPYGSSKNESTPGAGDGTPYEIARANDIFGFQQALLKLASITPSGNAETSLISEYLQALVEVASGRAVSYDDSGAANVYVASLRTNQQGVASYFDGMVVEFTPSVDNTGPSTIDVEGTDGTLLGVKNIKTTAGNDPTAGILLSTKKVILKYDSVNGWFEINEFDLASIPDGLITAVKLNADVPLRKSFVSAEQTITSAGALTIPHGFGSTPSLIQARLICKVSEVGYPISDELMIGNGVDSAGNPTGLSIVPDITNLSIRYGQQPSAFLALNKTTGVLSQLTNANWKLIVRAWV